MKICIYGASSSEMDSRYGDAVELLGGLMAQRGYELVFGGGATGMMGAAVRGCARFGGKSYGIAPSFFDVEGVLYRECTKLILTQTMRERKKRMQEMSDAFVVTPGGLGTMDEFFEIVTLKQLGRHQKPIVIYNCDRFFDPLLAMIEDGIRQKCIRPQHRELYRVFDQAEPMLDFLEQYA